MIAQKKAYIAKARGKIFLFLSLSFKFDIANTYQAPFIGGDHSADILQQNKNNTLIYEPLVSDKSDYNLFTNQS